MLMPGFSSAARAGAGAAVRRPRGHAGAARRCCCRPCVRPLADPARRPMVLPLIVSETADRRADRADRARSSSWRCSSWRSQRRCSSASARWRGAPHRGHRAAAAAGHVDHADGDRAAVRHRSALGGAARAARRPIRRCPSASRSRPTSAWSSWPTLSPSAFILALQISSPFIVYALIINLMVGIANKLIPQIPVYFISRPSCSPAGCCCFISPSARLCVCSSPVLSPG